MKKITLLIVVLICCIVNSYGQLTESFEGTWPPAGWTIVSTNTSFTWEENATGIGFGKSAHVGYDFAQDESLISPVFTVPVGSPSLKFKVDMSYYWSVDPNNNMDVLVSISTDGGSTWAQIWDETQLGVFTSWTPINVEVPLASYSGMTNVQLKFEYVGDDGADLDIDEIAVALPPTTVPDCATLTAPTDAQTAIDYTVAVNLTWDAPVAGSLVDSYDVYLDTNTNPTTLLINTTGLTTTATGLIPSTTYYWKVISKNVAGDATGCWVFSFTTMSNPFAPYCGPIAFSFNVEPITLVNFAGINNVTDPTVNGTPGHEDFTAMVASVTQGSTYPITLMGNSDGNWTNRYIVFIDWNQNGVLNDTGEVYFSGTADMNTVNSTGVDAIQAVGNILVPTTALTGNTRMRVKKIFGTTNFIDPCLGAAFGQVEEYTVNVSTLGTTSFDNGNFNAYPNPVKNILNLSFTKTITNVSVSNLLGQEIMAKSINANQSQVDMSNLATGTYMVKVTSDNEVKTIKVIKE